MTTPERFLAPLTRARRALAALALAGAALATSGASCDTTETIFPEIAPAEHRLVVMPMKDRLQYHFDSPRGIALAQMVSDHLTAKRRELGEDAMDVVPFDDLAAEIGKVRKDPKDIPPGDIGRMVKADLVLIGDIERFETHIPGDIGFARGRANVNLRVIDVAKPDRALFTKKLAITFPEEGRTNTGIMMGADASADAVETGLMQTAAKKIAELFYVHDVPKTRG